VLSLSAGIASLGLSEDSAATIIGAMLSLETHIGDAKATRRKGLEVSSRAR
jgi:uncharacterized membrane protein